MSSLLKRPRSRSRGHGGVQSHPMRPMRPARSRSGTPRMSALARVFIPDGASLGARVFFSLLAVSILCIAVASVVAILSRDYGQEDSTSGSDPIRTGMFVAMATMGTAFALVLGAQLVAWLRDGKRPALAAFAFPAGLVVVCATVAVLMATMPSSLSPVRQGLKIASYVGLGLLVLALAWEAIGQFAQLLRHRDWFRAALWLVGVALLLGLVLLRSQT